MEKNPNSSTKVPPRSSSTGPPPGESKAKSGEKGFVVGCHFPRCGPPFGGLAGPSGGGLRGRGGLFVRADVAAKTFELSFGAKANMLTERTRTDDVHAVSCIR